MTALTIDKIIEYDDATVIEVGPLLYTQESFTRSNGTMFSRIYERLTKASRRRVEHATHVDIEIGQSREQTIENAYRRGVKDTLEALRKELS